MNITVTKNPNPGKLPPADQLGFGSVFTDQESDRFSENNRFDIPFCCGSERIFELFYRAFHFGRVE